MKKIKILYVGLTKNTGGIETYIYNLYKNIDQKKFEIAFLITKNEKVYKYNDLKNAGVCIFEIRNRRKNFIGYLLDLKKVYSNNEFDYIHFHTSKFSNFFKFLFAFKYSNAQILIHSHQFRTKKIKNILTRFLDKLGKHLISNKKFYGAACSLNAYNYMFKNCKNIVNRNPIIFNNGIDLKKFKYSDRSRKVIRNSLNLSNNTILFGNVGRLSIQKNQLFLIDVFNEIHKKNINTRLIILGDGELKRKIQKKIINYNLENSVKLLGNQDNVNDYFSAMDCLILPSIYEGFGLVLIEAQACNLRIFASDKVIPKNTKLSRLLDFISLDNNSLEWANIILNSSLDKINVHSEILKMQFDIFSSVKMVEKFYIENIKKEISKT